MHRTIVLPLLVLLGGCSSNPLGSDGWQLVPGRMDPALSSIQAVVAPASVVAGAPFSVTLNTVGSSSCTRAHDTEVEAEGHAISLTPLNWEAPGDRPCTDDLAPFPHQVTGLRFPQPGAAVLRIHARNLSGSEIVLETFVNVVPE